ncbi:MAG TPA: hypothetical protein VMZ00_14865 [Sporichthya sp.]|nr:hypothetical protein [Sporichthya sp.]
MSIVEGTGHFDLRRALLSLAVALTVVAVAIGTWVLGSGSDPGEQDLTPVVADISAPSRAQPPLPVAPLPAPGQEASAG